MSLIGSWPLMHRPLICVSVNRFYSSFCHVSDTKSNLSRVKREHSYHLTKLFPASYMLGLRVSAQYGTDSGPSSLLGIFRIGEMIYWMRSKLACFPWESLLLSFVRALTKIILPSGACESVTFFSFNVLWNKESANTAEFFFFFAKKGLEKHWYLNNTNLNDTYHVKEVLEKCAWSISASVMPQSCVTYYVGRFRRLILFRHSKDVETRTLPSIRGKGILSFRSESWKYLKKHHYKNVLISLIISFVIGFSGYFRPHLWLDKLNLFIFSGSGIYHTFGTKFLWES